jgi:hypothetical protein
MGLLAGVRAIALRALRRHGGRIGDHRFSTTHDDVCTAMLRGNLRGRGGKVFEASLLNGFTSCGYGADHLTMRLGLLGVVG